jgi:CheY-like chemotaxis protein
MNRILIVAEDKAMQLLYTDALTEKGYEAIAAGAASDLMALIEENRPDLVVLDDDLGEAKYRELFRAIRNRHAGLPIVVSTNNLSPCDAGYPGIGACELKGPRMSRLMQKIGTLFPVAGPRTIRPDSPLPDSGLPSPNGRGTGTWQPNSES